jgi:hypothetical protein
MADVWTSGSSEGASCDVERSFAWCDSGKLLNATDIANEKFWTQVPAVNSAEDRCIALHLDAIVKNVALQQVSCLSKRPFICQVLK